MFNNLSQRERVLALLLVTALPMLLLMAFGWWFYGSYNKNRKTISSLNQQLGAEDDLSLRYDSAMERRDWYRSVSLPSDLSVAQSNYKDWLNELAQEKLPLGESLITVDPQGGPTPVRYQGQIEIFHELKFKISGTTTLEKLTEFLYEFHRSKVLHRIRSFTINPVERKVPGGNELERTELIRIVLDVTAAALFDAEETRDNFDQRRETLTLGLEEYKNKIVFRDIFGPANNQPKLTTSPSQRFTVGSSAQFRLAAEDEDENDELTFKIVDFDSELKDFELNSRGNSATLNLGRLEKGTYRLTAQVTDNGCPAKTDSRKITIRIEDKVVTKKPDDPPPAKPRFQHAKAAHLTAVYQPPEGKPQVWINVRTLGDFHQLIVGESFKLDGFKWTVKSIDVDQKKVVIARDEDDFTYQMSEFLFRELPEISTSRKGSSPPDKENRQASAKKE